MFNVLHKIQKEALPVSAEFKTVEMEVGPEHSAAHQALRFDFGRATVKSFAESWIGDRKVSRSSSLRQERTSSDEL